MTNYNDDSDHDEYTPEHETPHPLVIAPGQALQEAGDALRQSLAVPCRRHPEQRLVPREHGIRCAVGSEPPVLVTLPPAPCPACAERGRLARYGVPERYLDSEFGNFVCDTPELQRNLETCRRFAAKPEGFLVMLGKVGVGKSRLIASILRAARKPGGHYTTHAAAIYELRKSYRTECNSDNPGIRDVMRAASILAVDELGVNVNGNDGETMMFDVLDSRYTGLRPTILAGNIQPNALEGVLGERLTDRVREMLYENRPLVFTGPSRRASLNPFK